MSVADRSIDPRIMESAKEEFLQKGFLDASLQVICKNAGVYDGRAVQAVQGKGRAFLRAGGEHRSRPRRGSTAKICFARHANGRTTQKGVGHGQGIYAVVVRLSLRPLRRNAPAARFFGRDEVRKLRARMGGGYESYYLCVLQGGAEAWADKTDISEKEMHVMLSAFWTAICEPLIHGFAKEEAGRISDLMCGLFDWYKMLGFER